MPYHTDPQNHSPISNPHEMTPDKIQNVDLSNLVSEMSYPPLKL